MQTRENKKSSSDENTSTFEPFFSPPFQCQDTDGREGSNELAKGGQLYSIVVDQSSLSSDADKKERRELSERASDFGAQSSFGVDR